MKTDSLPVATPLSLSIQTTDFDEMAVGIPGWETTFSQMSRGPFHGTLQLLKFSDVSLYHLSANREILARGAHLPKTFGFSVITQKPVTSVWNGRPLGPDQIVFLGPNGTLDHKTCLNYDAYFVELNADAFLAGANALTARDVESDLACKILLSPTAGAAHRLRDGIRQVLALGNDESKPLNQPGMQKQVFHALLSQIAGVIVESGNSDVTPGRLRTRGLLVQEAEALMDARLDGSLSVLEICQSLCISERGLHYAFREILGQTPMTFYRHKRLNAVRRKLKLAIANETSIRETSRSLGFKHSGQFAADYRRLFGRLPSET